MHITNLELRNFRNYETLSMDFDQNVNLIIGPNAQGKTNLIEAIYLSSIGRSFRVSHDSEMIRFGQPYAFVRVECSKEYIDTKVEIRIQRDHKKQIKKDGTVVRRSSDLLENIILVIFSPEDMKIVKEEPEKRRKFIDHELAQIKPAYYTCLSNYKKTLQQRNFYLKEDVVDPSILGLWDEQLIRYGADLMRMRKNFIDQLCLHSSKIHSSITNGKEKLRLEYDPNLPYEEDVTKQRKIIEDALLAASDNDRRLRTTTKGPHKDDMLFFVNEVNARAFGSQGQQRTCALSLKLAELEFIRKETGESGILLLDDVMSELDEERRRFLVSTLAENQLFITGTDIDQGILEMYPNAKIMKIREGKCE